MGSESRVVVARRSEDEEIEEGERCTTPTIRRDQAPLLSVYISMSQKSLEKAIAR
jgi:hypothetical protein